MDLKVVEEGQIKLIFQSGGEKKEFVLSPEDAIRMAASFRAGSDYIHEGKDGLIVEVVYPSRTSIAVWVRDNEQKRALIQRAELEEIVRKADAVAHEEVLCSTLGMFVRGELYLSCACSFFEKRLHCGDIQRRDFDRAIELCTTETVAMWRQGASILLQIEDPETREFDWSKAKQRIATYERNGVFWLLNYCPYTEHRTKGIPNDLYW